MFSKLDAENLVLVVTSRCNLRCSHCRVRKENKDMNFETAWKAVSLFLEKKASYGCRRIKFFGGEPLLCFGLIENIVKKVNSRFENVVFRLSTNGVLLDEKVIKFLNKNPNVELVVSSSNIGILERKKELLKKVLDLPLATISANFLPTKIKESEEKFFSLLDRGFSRFNFLPAYFTPWRKKEIALLGKSLTKVAKTINTFPREIYVTNLEVESAVPLFNLSPAIDQEGNIMAGNFFLDERFSYWKDELKLGNIQNVRSWNDILGLSFNFDFLVRKTFSSSVIESNRAVDHELSRFVDYLKKEK